MRRLVVDLSQRLGSLEAQVAELRDELEKTEMARATLQAENQDLRDEIARLKNLPPRPPFKPSGMEQATNREPGQPSGKRQPRGPKRDTDRVSREEVLIAKVPAGSRFKGYETCRKRRLHPIDFLIASGRPAAWLLCYELTGEARTRSL